MGQWVRLRDANMNTGYTGGWCLKFVQDSFGTDHPYPSAIDAWNANYGGGNHPGEVPPLGLTVPVYLSLGNVPAGHVADRLDDGYVASSTQAGYHSTPYFHPSLNDLINVYGKYNGGATYLGWSQFVGTVKVVAWQDSHSESTTTDIAFNRTTIDDPTLPLGQTKVTQSGQNGVQTTTYEVTTLDGAEQYRTQSGQSTTDAIDEITAIGSYVTPISTPDPVDQIPTTTPDDPVETTPPTETTPIINIPSIPVVIGGTATNLDNEKAIIKRIVVFLQTLFDNITAYFKGKEK